jgi:hypothetical protein
VNILNGLDGSINLDVNMRVELLEEVRVIWNDLIVITDDLLAREAWFTDRKRPAVVPAAVLGIAVFADDYYSRKRL